MNTTLFDIKGKEKGKINLPSCFSAVIREDLIQKIIEAKKTKQPYAPSPEAGKQTSARGKIRHRRHVWQTHYGRGMSRIPRKVMSKRGSQFNWEGAGIPSTKGGPRAHPPKIVSMINTKRINKKEMELGLKAALSATANPKTISKRYSKIDEKEVSKAPYAVDSKITTLKTKELVGVIKNILGKNLFEKIEKKKVVRSGVGKLRGRKYKQNAGLLIVVGKDEKIKTKNFEICTVSNLGVSELAKGGAGRIVLFTENAIKELDERFGGKKK